MSNICLKWSVAAESVRGFTHIKQNKPCQDAIYAEQLEDGALIVAADGHGSERCSYSEDGARIAVEITSRLLRELCSSTKRLETIEDEIKISELLHSIEETWKSSIDKYHSENEREILNRDQLYIKYGTTLLGVLVTSEFIFCLQLGDGDIIIVTKNKQVKFAIKKDENLIGNETTSLCSHNSYKQIKTKIKYIKDEEPPVLILLSTDGYYNSFISVDDFKKVGVDYLNLIKIYGLDEVKKHMGAWLEDSSKEGSGDDITLGLICSDKINEVEKEISIDKQLSEEIIEEPLHNKNEFPKLGNTDMQKEEEIIVLQDIVEKKEENEKTKQMSEEIFINVLTEKCKKLGSK
jgi:Serine/threonine protein phosphatase